MDRYLAFCGNGQSPKGGWSDFVSSHESLDQALEAIVIYCEEFFTGQYWWHIADIEMCCIACEGQGNNLDNE